jgi:hypothetical protein
MHPQATPAPWLSQQMCTNGNDEFVHLKRLLEGCGRTELAQARRRHAGDDDDGNGGKGAAVSLVSPKGPSIHDRHRHIQHDEARRIGVRFVEPVLTVAREIAIEALAHQQLRHYLAVIRIIVDNQNAWTHRTVVTQVPRLAPVRHSAVSRCKVHHGRSPRK